MESKKKPPDFAEVKNAASVSSIPATPRTAEPICGAKPEKVETPPTTDVAEVIAQRKPHTTAGVFYWGKVFVPVGFLFLGIVGGLSFGNRRQNARPSPGNNRKGDIALLVQEYNNIGRAAATGD